MTPAQADQVYLIEKKFFPHPECADEETPVRVSSRE
jgi:hypothetical protein